MRVAIALCLLLSMPCSAAAGVGCQSTEAPDASSWRTDIEAIRSALQRRHPDPFHTISRQELEAGFRQLEGELSSLSPHEIVVRLQQLVARVGDAHTYLALPTPPHPLAFRGLPVRFELFTEGLYVTEATAENGRLAGKRVVRLGALSAREAVDRIRGFVSRDNAATADFLAPGRLRIPEVLHGLGIAPHAERVRLEVEGEGGSLEVVYLEPLPQAGEPRWEDARDREALLESLYWRDSESSYWLLSLPDRQSVYLQLNRTVSDPRRPLAELAEELARLLARDAPRRLVIDLRRNIGGNWKEAQPLIRALLESGRFFTRGRLVLLVGRGTISAAVVLAQEIARYTEVVYVGEPTGSRPNQFGDNEPAVVLPCSQLELAVASAYFQTGGPYAFQPWIAPDVFVPPSATNYFAVADPALAAALEYEVGEPFDDRLRRLAAAGDAGGALELFGHFDEDERNRFVDVEREIRLLGRELAAAGHAAAAVELLRRNARRYPERARPLVELGMALDHAGRRDEARSIWRQARDLVPTDPSLTVVLRERLGATLEELMS
ncbi:MAG TPA: hypothetical protein VMS86_13930 [Thermoanaerobaculia bacterium]|nr:hypothetical protein [Thermoanaerobaculia bacterium]